jgi:flagellar biosynthesis protein FlhG
MLPKTGNLKRRAGHIFAVAGGKGGVGKSIFSISLGTLLAEKGYKVIIVDFDLGSANLHTYLGILEKTPSLADFVLRRCPTLEEIVIKTHVNNLSLISGAEFLPGMANPAHWIKLKMIRNLIALSADFVIIDLGAGVYYNTLDFYNISDSGFVVAVPEPGSILNAYGFIKGALFRKLQNIFKSHTKIGPLIKSGLNKTGANDFFSFEWLRSIVQELDPEMLPMLQEIKFSFQPALVVNRATKCETLPIVENLMRVCNDQLGIPLRHLGNIPEVKSISRYLLNIPGFYKTQHGAAFLKTVNHIYDELCTARTVTKANDLREDFCDEEIEELQDFIDTLDDRIFEGTNKKVWKLRMCFKPLEVLNFLLSRGVNHELFYSY